MKNNRESKIARVRNKIAGKFPNIFSVKELLLSQEVAFEFWHFFLRSRYYSVSLGDSSSFRGAFNTPYAFVESSTGPQGGFFVSHSFALSWYWLRPLSFCFVVEIPQQDGTNGLLAYVSLRARTAKFVARSVQTRYIWAGHQPWISGIAPA